LNRLTITAEAWAAIVATLPDGVASLEPHEAPWGGVCIMLDDAANRALMAAQRVGEALSDTILRLAEEETTNAA
jgi:hypothetical protein